MISLLCVFFWSISVHTQSPSRTDTKRCKVTHTGIEYAGTISHTDSGILCKYWETATPTNIINPPVTDVDFPEGSKVAAKNYCRNIRGVFQSPWCYTTDPEVAEEICNVPLCNFKCQVTLIGAEYGGYKNESFSGRKCLKWSEKTYRKYLKKHKIVTSDRILLDENFPELSRQKAADYCRNPTNDPNGPWCIVESDFSQKIEYELEYCEIPLCDGTNCTAGTSRMYNKNAFSHFISLGNATTFEFSILLWSIDFHPAIIHVLFCAYPLPLSGKTAIDMYNGIELLMNKHRIGFSHGKNQAPTWQEIPHLLSGVHKRTFTVSWYPEESYISLKISNHSKIIQTEYNDPKNKDKTIIGTQKGKLSYYSIFGDVALWDLPCPGACEEQITIEPYCNIHRKMNKTEFAHEIPFIVRSDHTVILELRTSPNSKYPYFRIEILGAWNKTSIALFQRANSTPEYLHSASYDNILSYWSWSKFQLSVSEEHLQLNWIQPLIPSETVIDMKHILVANAKWYSICSDGTAHWMFDCDPLNIPMLPERQPPECAQNKKAETYEGEQWVASSGQPCFPWVYDGVVELTLHYSFGKTSRDEIKNYCRNLDDDPNGPFCFIADVASLPLIVMKRESCNIRSCPASQCLITGLGREYNGNLNVTRSGRMCKPWLEANVSFPTNEYAANVSENYCRNPDNQTLGPWCYTTDPMLPADLCDIHDCFVNDACTIITQDDRPSRKFYIRPEWISDKFSFKVKTWDPLLEAGISIFLAYENSSEYFSLEIGIENNTKVELKYHFENGTTASLKDQLAPKLIPSGYWQGFWIRVPPNNIELGYEGSETSIFIWEHNDDSDVPYTFARFITFLNLGYHLVGFNFPCDYCLLEEVETIFADIYYPINFWAETNPPGLLTLHMRAVGDDTSFTVIRLYEMNISESLGIFITNASIKLTPALNVSIVYGEINTTQKILSEHHWTTITIRFNDTYMEVDHEHEILLRWNSTGIRVLNFYYFVITNGGEITTWVPNCHRPVIDEPPVDGGWSEWSDWVCNVRCGGGLGFRTRNCSNPKPNFNGKPCLGPSTEDGECNKFECGCINPTSIEKAKKQLELHAFNKEVNDGGSITLECDKSILEDIKIDSSGSFIEWLKNGYAIKNNKKKFDGLDLSKTDLILTDAQEDDSGVYICIVHPDCLPATNSTFIPISIAAVVVNSKQIHYVHETVTYQLICKGISLSFIYTDLSQSWELDNELLIDYTTTALAETNIDNLYDVEPYHTGVWQCKIFQSKLKFTWITNRFRIEVTEPPSVYSYLTEEDAPSVIFRGWNHTLIVVFLWLVIILEIAAVTYIVYWYWKTRQELLGNA